MDLPPEKFHAAIYANEASLSAIAVMEYLDLKFAFIRANSRFKSLARSA